MFDATYDTAQFARMLALLPHEATSADMVVRHQGFHTLLTVNVDDIRVQLSILPYWARGELAVRLDAAGIALLRKQIMNVTSTRVWVQASYGRVYVAGETSRLSTAA